MDVYTRNQSSGENKPPNLIYPPSSRPTTPRGQEITIDPKITWAPPRKSRKGK